MTIPAEFPLQLATFGPDSRAELEALAERNKKEPSKKLKTREKAIGYVAYRDRFAKDLTGVATKIP